MISALCQYGNQSDQPFSLIAAVIRYRLPVTWENVEAYLYCPRQPACINADDSILRCHAISTFSPLLEGYFHNPFTKIYTIHLLSVHPKIMYSSLSLHF